jgi:uncharacterized protein YjbI with pentapeptide repeats
MSYILIKKFFASVLVVSFLALITDCKSGRIRYLLKSHKLVGANLSGQDFYNLALHGINLTRARLVRTSLTFCNLKKARFVNADLRLTDLSASDLSEADLRGANLRNANCHAVILRKAILIDAYFYDADLSGADLRGAVMTADTPDGNGGKNMLPAVYFAHFRNADFSGTAVSAQWKNFILKQGVRNYDKIIWAR